MEASRTKPHIATCSTTIPPGETLLQLLEEGGFVDFAKWWTALENCHEKLHGGRIDRFYRKELCDSQYLGGRLSTE